MEEKQRRNGNRVITFIDQERQQKVKDEGSPDDKVADCRPVRSVEGDLPRDHNDQGSEGGERQRGVVIQVLAVVRGSVQQCPIRYEENDERAKVHIHQAVSELGEENYAPEHAVKDGVDEDPHVEKQVELAREIQLRVSEQR